MKNKNTVAEQSRRRERKGNFTRKTTETDIKLSLNLDGKGIYDINTGIPFFNHMLEQFSKHSRFDTALNAKGDIEVDFHHLVEDAGIVIGGALKELSGDKNGIRRFGFASVPMDEALVQTEARAEASVDFCGRSFFVYNKNGEESSGKRAKGLIASAPKPLEQGEDPVSSLLNALKRDKNIIDSVLKKNKGNESITREQLYKEIQARIYNNYGTAGEIMAEKFFYDYVSIFFDALSKNALMTLHINVMYGSNMHHIVEAIFKSAGRAIADALKIDGNYGVPSTKGSI